MASPAKPADPGAGPAGASAATPLVEHLFRRQSGKLVAALTRSLGPARLDLAEEAVQEAMVEALRRWPFHGVPERPAGWLYRVARNRALDRLRRESTFRGKEPEVRREVVPEEPQRSGADARFSGELTDDQLRLIFLCCHPALPRDARVALTLKTVCGFGVPGGSCSGRAVLLPGVSAAGAGAVYAGRRGGAGAARGPGPVSVEPAPGAPRETRFHLEAAIASQHAAAASWEETDWPAILELYDRLVALMPSPVVRLNRAVAVARVEGPRAGLTALQEMEVVGGAEELGGYHLLPATRGALLVEAGDRAGAAQAFRDALTGCRSGPERRLLERRLAQVGGRWAGREPRQR